MRWAARDSELRALVKGGDAIVPGSVHYAPTGEWIAFVRAKGDGERSLWVVGAGGEAAPTPVYVGQIGLESTFSPDGRWIAFNVETENGPQISIADTREGRVTAQLGHGRLTQESFHPSGQYLVVTAEDEETGSPQMIAVSSEAPHERQAITALEEGVLLGGAVSRDGRWAAAALASGELVFVDLSAQFFAAPQTAAKVSPIATAAATATGGPA